MDELHRRGQALENSFFRAKDFELLEKMHREMAIDEGRSALAAATGIDNVDVLSALIALGISTESLTAVSLIPLVFVAWSDGAIHDKEREALLQAADGAGIENGSAGYRLLERWLRDKPSDELYVGWKSYISEIRKTLDETTFAQLKTSIVGRAKNVAEAAGGFLGIGKISTSEENAITDLESAF